MSDPLTEDAVLTIVRKYGTVTANRVGKESGHKQETAKRALDKLVSAGKVYTEINGKTTYYIAIDSGERFHLNRKPKKTEPDTPPSGEKVETLNGMYVRTPCQVSRATVRTEIIPRAGFVCYPTIKGTEVDRQFIRVHINGEYQVPINKVGKVDNRTYIPTLDTFVEWVKKGLNGNVQFSGKLYLHPDTRPFKIRMVSNKDGNFDKLCVKVHPRYVYYTDCIQTADAEFTAQTVDVCNALRMLGWSFDITNITHKGQPHFALNDTALGQVVGEYNQHPDDMLHFDHSHGTPECEIYGTSDPASIDMMVRLPEIIRAFGVSIAELNHNLAVVVDMQSKTLNLINGVIAVQNASIVTPDASVKPYTGDVMYG